MANPNIINSTQIFGQTVGINVTTGTGTVGILTNTASSGKVFKINTIRCSNLATNNATSFVDLGFNTVGVASTTYLAFKVQIPGSSSLIVVNKDNGIYLNENTRVACACTAQNISVTISYEDIS